MEPSTAVDATVATLRRRPADLLPFYVLGGAVPGVTRVVTVFGLALAYAHLELTGRLDRFAAALADSDLDPPDPQTEPEAFSQWATEVSGLVDVLVTPTVLAVLGGAVLVSLVLLVVLRAGVAAGQLAACHARLRDERGLTAGIGGVRRHWLSFVGLLVLEVGLWIAVTLLMFGGVAAAGSLSTLAGLAAGILAVPLWLGGVLLVRAVFAFAPVAVVVDDAGVLGGIRGGFGFLRARPGAAGAYFLVVVAVLVGGGFAAALLAVVGVGSLAALLGLLAVFPGLDLLKTALFGGYRGTVGPPDGTAAPLSETVPAGLRRGWRAMVGFVRERPGLHALAFAVTLLGGATGWTIAGPLAGAVDSSIAARLDGQVPFAAAPEYFANNWSVALTTAYAGVVLALPSAVSLWFNGFLLGAYARTEVAVRELVAFVVPHGVVEFPALFVAGALGLHLGIVGWRTWRGRRSRAALADAMERAFRVLVGVGLLLAVAGFVEGFVSPYYYRPFL